MTLQCYSCGQMFTNIDDFIDHMVYDEGFPEEGNIINRLFNSGILSEEEYERHRRDFEPRKKEWNP